MFIPAAMDGMECDATYHMTQVVEEFDGPYLRVAGIEKPLLNMANFDFLGMGQRKELKEAAVLALDKVRRRVRACLPAWVHTKVQYE